MTLSMICCNGARMRYDVGATRYLFLFFIFIICITTFTIIHLSGSHSLSAEVSDTDSADDGRSYGIVFDCGSSGTRVYMYYWPPHVGDSHQLLDIHQMKTSDGKPYSKKVSPGLSTYSTNTTNSAEYLKPLLEFAAGAIPSEKHSQTPLYILATAGMRLIPKQAADAILDDVVKDIPNWFDFQFNRSHAEVISGKTEGMYAWISLNYMLNRFPHGNLKSQTTSSFRQQTVGVIDMGGGSLQIAFEVNKSKLKTKEKLVTFSLGSNDDDPFHKYSLYVTTFLGFGANKALDRYKQGLTSLVAASNTSAEVKANCLPLDRKDELEYQGKTYTIKGTGNVTACMSDVRPLLNQTTHCSFKPCTIDGVYQPSISSHAQFYGISEYWYSTYDVLDVQGTYDHMEILKRAQAYCGTTWSTIMDKWEKKEFPHADKQRLRNECFKVSWIMSVFHDGLHFSKDFSNFLPVNEIEGQEVQWSLGALIHRTRHLAARQTIRSYVHMSERSTWSRVSHTILPYGLLLCFVIVIGAIMMYCRHLQRMKVVPTLTSVPSMSYFMTNADQAELGLVKERLYYH